MARLIDTLTWVQDGERATATVFNRTLKEFAALVDAKDFKVLSSTTGLKINIAELDSLVQEGDLVYKGSDNIYYQALGADPLTENIVGVYLQIDLVPTIVWNGVVGKVGLTVGSSYYLSDTVPGAITDIQFNGAIKVGIAISSTQLLLNSTGGGSGGGGATGGGTDDVFYESSQVITSDYTITAGKNAMTAGPISINDGATVTVPDGSIWVII